MLYIGSLHSPTQICSQEVHVLPEGFGLLMLQEFRRLQLALGAARDRADLLAGTSDSSPLQVSIQMFLCHNQATVCVVTAAKPDEAVFPFTKLHDGILSGCRPPAPQGCS